MRGNNLEQPFKISEFAALAGVSAQALRLYERKGLLCPVAVSDYNSYRYYSAAQLYIVRQIKQLQALGLPLSEIKKCIVGDLSVDYEAERLEELEKQVKLRLAAAKLQKKYNMRYPAYVSVRKEGYYYKKPVHVAHYRELLGEFEQVNREIDETRVILSKPDDVIVEYPYAYFKETDLDITLYARVEKTHAKNVELLPAEKLLTCICLGGYDNLRLAYDFLIEYAKIYSYKRCGNFSEAYLISPYQTEDDTQYVTELRMPVK